jgi:alkylation response protein AidB-like acyl-CoA dehydrogenase
MIDWLVNKLFWYTPLREALISEATFYNSLTRTINDPEAMKTASAFWDEGDGWRGWSIEGNKYYFNDVPEHDLMGIILAIEEMHEQRPL